MNFSSANGQRITTIVNHSMIPQKDIAIVSIKLTHIDSGYSDTDTMVMSCGTPGSC